MKSEILEDGRHDRDPRAEPGLGAPAGVFLLEGEFHVAALGGGRAQSLRRRGALLVASLLFTAASARLATAGGARGTLPPGGLAPFSRGRPLPAPAVRR